MDDLELECSVARDDKIVFSKFDRDTLAITVQTGRFDEAAVILSAARVDDLVEWLVEWRSRNG